jgi:hypothetical protein
MTPTPNAASSSVKWLALGAALLLASAAGAQTAQPSESDLAFMQSALSAKAAQSVAAQKASAKKAAAARVDAPRQSEDEELADGWGATAVVPTLHAESARVTPDSSFTPGHLCSPSDPNFKEYRYAEHIPYCNRNVTPQMKTAAAAHYGVPQSEWTGYEFDHLIPLAIGGDSSIDNVWPQPHGDPDGSNGKDKLEDLLYREMAAGSITQAEAVKQIYGWFTAVGMAAEATQITAR